MNFMHVADVLEAFPSILREELEKTPEVRFNFKKAVFFGMGASAIAPMILSTVIKEVRVINTNLCSLPLAGDEGKIAISYSGNTEETLMNANFYGVDVVITSNGKLQDLAHKKMCKVFFIPPNMVPRASFPYLFASSLRALLYLGVVRKEKYDEIKRAILDLNFSAIKKDAQKISSQFEDKIVYILADTEDFVAAYRFKTQLNENAKMFSFIEELPEANHNSLMMWKHATMKKNILPVIIESQNEFVRESQRFIYENVLKEEGIWISIKEREAIKRALYIVYLGDWISYYLAIERNIIPEDTSIIEELKRWRRNK